MANESMINSKRGWLALSPLIVFLAFYFVFSLLAHDFYTVPITVAFMVASAYSILLLRGLPLDERIKVYSKGAAHSNLLMMVWIFILAGAFAYSAKQMGAIQATVDLCLWALPPRFLLAGLFLASCLISLSVGTSVGTIVALVPIATGIASSMGDAQLSTFNFQLSTPFVVGVVVGGAYFGDNLSFISDTTIVATQTQGCQMRDKFRTNARIVIPAALLVLIVYVLMGWNMQVTHEVGSIDWVLVVPYLLVLGTAIMGMNSDQLSSILIDMTRGVKQMVKDETDRQIKEREEARERLKDQKRWEIVRKENPDKAKEILDAEFKKLKEYKKSLFHFFESDEEKAKRLSMEAKIDEMDR